MNLPLGAKDNSQIISLASFKSRDAAIGKLLLDAGKLKQQDLVCVFKLQREEGLRFGEAAVKLGLVSEADIQHALSYQFEYPYMSDSHEGLSPELVAAAAPNGKKVEILRSVRSQLLLRWFQGSHKILAIGSTTKVEGASYLAANLAVLFSQLGKKTLLIDADMREPRQHEMFNLGHSKGLSDILAGRAEATISCPIKSFPTLAVLTAGSPPPNPSELLVRPVFGALLSSLESSYDVILIDTPPFPYISDFQSVAKKTGGVLIAARHNVSRLGALTELKEKIIRTSAQVIGVVVLD